MVKSNMQSRRVRKCARPRRSPMRAALPTAVKGARQKGNPIRLLKAGLQKTKRASRRIKLIDAKSRKVGGTSVLFLPNDSPWKSGKSIGTILESPVVSTMKIARLRWRFMDQPKAREGVDFFCNLGQRVLHAKPLDRPKGLRSGKRGLASGIVRGRPMAVGLEAGRLEAGGLGAAVAKVNGLSTGGPKVGAKRGIDLAEVPRGTEVPPAMGLGTLCPGPVLNSGASLAAKDVVVPLTNRLPIIDFISTNEFNKMSEAQKSPRRHNR